MKSELFKSSEHQEAEESGKHWAVAVNTQPQPIARQTRTAARRDRFMVVRSSSELLPHQDQAYVLYALSGCDHSSVKPRRLLT